MRNQRTDAKKKLTKQPLEKEPPPLLRHRSYIDFLPVVRSIAERDERQCHKKKTKQNKTKQKNTHTRRCQKQGQNQLILPQKDIKMLQILQGLRNRGF
jgi:hypothetical protein